MNEKNSEDDSPVFAIGESFVDECPRCSGALYLASCTVFCRVPIYPDGFYLGEGQLETSNEIVVCGNPSCSYSGPLSLEET